jgi:hypothetical protein
MSRLGQEVKDSHRPIGLSLMHTDSTPSEVFCLWHILVLLSSCDVELLAGLVDDETVLGSERCPLICSSSPF